MKILFFKILLSVCSLVLTFVVLEGVCGVLLKTSWGAGRGLPARVHFPDSPRNEGGQFLIPTSMMSKPIYKVGFEERLAQSSPPEFEYSVTPVKGLKRTDRGQDLLLNESYTQKIFNRTENVVLFQKDYIFDEYQRRVGFTGDFAKVKGHVLTMGCSQTLGDGLSADETLAAHLAQQLKDHRPYILAQGGAHPGQILALARHHRGLDNIYPSKGIAVIRVYGFHFSRMMKSLVETHGLMNLAHARYDKNGKIDVSQTYERTSPYRIALQKWVWGLNLRRALNLDYPLKYGPNELELMGDILLELKNLYLSKTSSDNLFVVLLEENESESWRPFYEALDRRGIHYIDYGGRKPYERSPRDVYIHLYNRHYNGEFNRISAAQILEDLAIN